MNPFTLRTALLSSYKKDKDLLDLAHLLKRNDWDLLGSSGTVDFLKKNKIIATDIASIVGKPILGHRVVTLSRELHAGLLATTPKDFEELDRLDIQPIGLVYVILYPLEEAVADPNVTMEEVIEKTDVGGPAMLHSAAKGRRVVISDPKQIGLYVAPWIQGNIFNPSAIDHLVAAAERRVADYVGLSATFWESRLKPI